MTIAAGFRCADGVVLCADTQMTLGITKFPESKFRFYGSLKCEPAFVYAGDRDFSVMAIDMISEAISSAEQSGREITEAVRKTLVEIHRKYFPLPTFKDQEPLYLRALACFWINGTRSLFSISGPDLAPADGCRCIGIGEYLGPYVTQIAFDKNLKWREAIYSAAYLLFCAKEFVPYCGGKPEIMSLRDRGRHFEKAGPMFNQFFDIQPEVLETHFRNLHSELRNVVLGFGNLSLNKKKYQEVLAAFSKNLEAMRKPHLKEMEAFYAQAFAAADEPMSDEELNRRAEEIMQEENDDDV